jgi:hypothetical protein
MALAGRLSGIGLTSSSVRPSVTVRGGTEMTEPVATVVELFKWLTAEEQTLAYLEIEEVWKALQDEPDEIS